MGHREYSRVDRINAELRKAIGALVHEMVRDRVLPSVSVSDVEVSRDLAHAKVFVTALLAEGAPQALRSLNEAAKELRQELSRVSRMRSVPQLHFFYDDSVDRGERIEALLKKDGPL